MRLSSANGRRWRTQRGSRNTVAIIMRQARHWSAMRGRVGAVVAALVAIFFAGCVGPDAQPQGGAAPQGPVVDGSGGSVVGTVVDDSFIPIAGAQVALSGAEFVAVTDAAGLFTMVGVPGGTYSLFAAALGYQSVGKSIDVVDGQETRVSITLAPIPVVEAYLEVYGPFDGYFECRTGTLFNSGECGWVTGSHPTFLYPNDRSIFRFNVTSDDMRTVIGDQRWQQGSAATSSAMRLAFSFEKRTGTHRWCSAESPSPLQFRWDSDGRLNNCASDSQPEADPPTMKMNPLRIYANMPFGKTPSASNPAAYSPPRDAPIYLSIQQRFQSIASVFYGEWAPEGYTGFPDA